MKSAYKWRLTNTVYAYITDEKNDKPFFYNMATKKRSYDGKIFSNSDVVDESIEVTISRKVREMTDFNNQYKPAFDEMVKLINSGDTKYRRSLLSAEYYYNLNVDSCVASVANQIIGERGPIGPAGPQGVIGPMGPQGEKGERGPQGSGAQGAPGYCGVVKMIFKHSEEMPEKPTGVKYNIISKKLVNLPEGWEEHQSGLEHPIWAATGQAEWTSSEVTEVNIDFTSLFRITGDDGATGADGVNTEFIYMRTKDATLENPLHEGILWPIDGDGKCFEFSGMPSYNVTDFVPVEGKTGGTGHYGTWKDHPEGISSVFRYEWMFQRSLQGDEDNKKWGKWNETEDGINGFPSLWSRWGEDGLDGDGTEYIYTKTTYTKDPSTGKKTYTKPDPLNPTPDDWRTNDAYQDTKNEYVPKGWNDEPSDTIEEDEVEWIFTRNYRYDENAKTKLWLPFGGDVNREPSIWREYVSDGEPGTGIDIKGTFDSYEELIGATKKKTDGKWYVTYKGQDIELEQGTCFTVSGVLYVWDGNASSAADGWQNAGNIKGEPGKDGTSYNPNLIYGTAFRTGMDENRWVENNVKIDGKFPTVVGIDGINAINCNNTENTDKTMIGQRVYQFLENKEDNFNNILETGTTYVLSFYAWGGGMKTRITNFSALHPRQHLARMVYGEYGGTPTEYLGNTISFELKMTPSRYYVKFMTSGDFYVPDSPINGLYIDFLAKPGSNVTICMPKLEKITDSTASSDKFNTISISAWCYNENEKIPFYHQKYGIKESGEYKFNGASGEEPDGAKYIGSYVDYKQNDSTNPKDYTWALFKGNDGFGYEYIFLRTATPTLTSEQIGSVKEGTKYRIGDDAEQTVPKTTWADADYFQQADFIPRNYDWKDNMQGVDGSNQYEWISCRRFIDGKWMAFSNPVLHSHYGESVTRETIQHAIIYPQGYWESGKKYKTTTEAMPYVVVPGSEGNKVFLFNPQDWSGRTEIEITSTLSPESDTANWREYPIQEAIFTKFLLADNALVGQAVFNGAYMFSQSGITQNGEPTLDYHKFNKNAPFSPDNDFRPNWCANFVTGEQWLGAGKIYFAADGSGYLADNNLWWDTNGNIYGQNAYFKGTFNNEVFHITAENQNEYLIQMGNGQTSTVSHYAGGEVVKTFGELGYCGEIHWDDVMRTGGTSSSYSFNLKKMSGVIVFHNNTPQIINFPCIHYIGYGMANDVSFNSVIQHRNSKGYRPINVSDLQEHIDKIVVFKNQSSSTKILMFFPDIRALDEDGSIGRSGIGYVVDKTLTLDEKGEKIVDGIALAPSYTVTMKFIKETNGYRWEILSYGKEEIESPAFFKDNASLAYFCPRRTYMLKNVVATLGRAIKDADESPGNSIGFNEETHTLSLVQDMKGYRTTINGTEDETHTLSGQSSHEYDNEYTGVAIDTDANGCTLQITSPAYEMYYDGVPQNYNLVVVAQVLITVEKGENEWDTYVLKGGPVVSFEKVTEANKGVISEVNNSNDYWIYGSNGSGSSFSGYNYFVDIDFNEVPGFIMGHKNYININYRLYNPNIQGDEQVVNGFVNIDNPKVKGWEEEQGVEMPIANIRPVLAFKY